MKVLNVNQQKDTACVQFNGRFQEIPVGFVENEDGLKLFIRVGGKVGATGTKIWQGVQYFNFIDGVWKKGTAFGGLNQRAFTPVCFAHEIPDNLRSQR